MAEVYEVLVDRYGHAGELMRGDVVAAADVAYDLAELERRSVVRRLRPEEVARLDGGTSTDAPANQAEELWLRGYEPTEADAVAHAERSASLRASARAQARQVAAEVGGTLPNGAGAQP